MGEAPVLMNRYQLQQSLGSGGMAVIFKAHDLMLERTVAIKILREDFSNDASFRERFKQEAKAAANLSHPNIVTIHDFGLDNGRLFIVMEYVPGTDLKTLLKQFGRFSVDETIRLITQACAGVGYAHRAGLIHCDIKPQNLLVTPDQRLKVADFGIARAMASIHEDEHNDVVWGSPQYFSPEQAAGAAPSPASDVYSLGIIMYEMLTGQLPFNADDASELARYHREVAPVSPRNLNPAIPEPLEQIILKVLAKEPSNRYRTADQFGRVLINYGARLTQYATQPSPAITQLNAPTPTVTTPTPSDGDEPAETVTDDHAFDIDWLTIGLGLLTVLAVGGLIPFWLFVWLSLNSPVR